MESTDLSEQIASLRRSVRLLLVLAATLGIATGAMAWRGRATSSAEVLERLTVRSLHVVDENGNIVATLAGEAQGPSLRLFGPGEDQVMLNIAGKEPGLTLFSGGKPTFMLSSTSSSLGPGPGPSLSFSGLDGGGRLIMGAKGGVPSLVMYDSQKQGRIVMGIGPEPLLKLMAPDGSTQFRAPAEK